MRGTEIPNHSANMATSVPKGMAADEPSTHRIRFIKKKSTNTILQRQPVKCVKTCVLSFASHYSCFLHGDLSTYPGHKKAVRRTLVFQFSPPKADETIEIFN